MKRIRVSNFFNILLLIALCALFVREDYPARILRKLSKPSLPKVVNHKQLPTELPHLDKKLINKEKILICAFGDSVTEGATQIGKYDFDNVYHNRLKRLLNKQYPNIVFNIINAGVGGDTSLDGLNRLKQDVLGYNPDLVLIEFALNDCHQGIWGIANFKANIQKMVDDIKANTKSDIILLTPNFMATSDNPNVSEDHRKKNYPKKFSELQNSGVLSAYASCIKEIGVSNNVPIADVYSKWQKLSSNINTNDLLSNGLNHPNKEGHLLMAYTIMNIIAPDSIFDLSSIETNIQKKSEVQKAKQDKFN